MVCAVVIVWLCLCLFSIPRTRRLLKRSQPDIQGTSKVLSMLQSVPHVKLEHDLEPGEGEGSGEAIVLDTIAEFCRQVGEKEEGKGDVV